MFQRKPAWGADINGITAHVETYEFERPDDPFWEPENQVFLLAEALTYAFDVAIGKEDEYAFESLLLRTEIEGDEIWGLIHEAQDVAKAVQSLGADELVQKIEEWKENSQSLYLSYRIEYASISISSNLYIPKCRVARLEAKLAEFGVPNG